MRFSLTISSICKVNKENVRVLQIMTVNMMNALTSDSLHKRCVCHTRINLLEYDTFLVICYHGLYVVLHKRASGVCHYSLLCKQLYKTWAAI